MKRVVCFQPEVFSVWAAAARSSSEGHFINVRLTGSEGPLVSGQRHEVKLRL